jgi:hypothetical protein
LSNRVLIVSPHFPPINAPDHQRVRISLPYLQEFGWQPHVLTVDPDYVEGVYDPLLEKTIPDNVPITRTKALPLHHTKRLGVGNLGLRALPYLLQAGNQLLAQERFNLVYFSTTMFAAMALGPGWLKKFKVPYVLDFQDPWLSNYHQLQSSPQPPGGRFKYGVAQLISQILEPQTVKSASQIISVSPAYPRVLRQRYSNLQEDQFTVLPFGAAEQDFTWASKLGVQQKVFKANDGKRHWVYVGRGGEDMAVALKGLFSAIQEMRAQDPEVWQSIRLHFVGTSYAVGERAVKTIEPIAHEFGLTDLVDEHLHRIPYFEALQVLVESDAILLIGSDDPGYSASKIYPCILAQKPTLAIFHQQSLVIDILKRCQVGRVIPFISNNTSQNLSKFIALQLHWLLSLPKKYKPKTNWLEFQAYSAREMTRRQCDVFEKCI